MEEILASIRRIIEDNENGRRQAELIEAQPEIRRSHRENTVIEVDSFRAELRDPPADTAQRRDERPASPRPLTLAEVQAQIKAEQAGEAARWPVDLPVRRSVKAPAAPQPEPEADDREDVEEAAPEPVAMDGVQAEAAAVPDEGAPRPAIVSEKTGRQVAAAFGELSEAFAARSRKTFDDMAAEMLRPMLQDWLDNNLPTLVERLVREEIERVARGA